MWRGGSEGLLRIRRQDLSPCADLAVRHTMCTTRWNHHVARNMHPAPSSMPLHASCARACAEHAMHVSSCMLCVEEKRLCCKNNNFCERACFRCMLPLQASAAACTLPLQHAFPWGLCVLASVQASDAGFRCSMHASNAAFFQACTLPMQASEAACRLPLQHECPWGLCARFRCSMGAVHDSAAACMSIVFWTQGCQAAAHLTALWMQQQLVHSDRRLLPNDFPPERLVYQDSASYEKMIILYVSVYCEKFGGVRHTEKKKTHTRKMFDDWFRLYCLLRSTTPMAFGH